MDSTRTARYDAYKAVRGLVEELRDVKLFDAEADSILWAAEGLLLANSPADAEAVEARTTFDTLMDGLAAQRWQDNGPTTAELQRKRLVEAFARFDAAARRPSRPGQTRSITPLEWRKHSTLDKVPYVKLPAKQAFFDALRAGVRRLRPQCRTEADRARPGKSPFRAKQEEGMSL